jgi:hypothetical protein
MKLILSFEISVNFYPTAGHNIPDDNYLQSHRSESLKSHMRVESHFENVQGVAKDPVFRAETY